MPRHHHRSHAATAAALPLALCAACGGSGGPAGGSGGGDGDLNQGSCSIDDFGYVDERAPGANPPPRPARLARRPCAHDAPHDRLARLREGLMESFRADPAGEWAAVRALLLRLRGARPLESLHDGAPPAEHAGGVRDFLAAVDADTKEVEAYARDHF